MRQGALGGHGPEQVEGGVTWRMGGERLSLVNGQEEKRGQPEGRGRRIAEQRQGPAGPTGSPVLFSDPQQLGQQEKADGWGCQPGNRCGVRAGWE